MLAKAQNRGVESHVHLNGLVTRAELSASESWADAISTEHAVLKVKVGGVEDVREQGVLVGRLAEMVGERGQRLRLDGNQVCVAPRASRLLSWSCLVVLVAAVLVVLLQLLQTRFVLQARLVVSLAVAAGMCAVLTETVLQCWTLEEAVQFVEAVGPKGAQSIEYIEEPLQDPAELPEFGNFPRLNPSVQCPAFRLDMSGIAVHVSTGTTDAPTRCVLSVCMRC